MQAQREVAYLFAVPQAATLASLVGAQADMMQVVSYCDLMLTRYAAGEHLKQSPFDIVGFTTPLDATDWEALSSATCVAYSRCFKTGVRHALDVAPLASERPDWLELHSFVLGLRDKHVAHSVNWFEENLVTVHIRDDFSSAAQIETVSATHTSRAGLSIDGPAKIKSLALWWVQRIESQITTEREGLLKIARSSSLDELKARGVPTHAPVTTSSDVLRARKRP